MIIMWLFKITITIINSVDCNVLYAMLWMNTLCYDIVTYVLVIKTWIMYFYVLLFYYVLLSQCDTQLVNKT